MLLFLLKVYVVKEMVMADLRIFILALGILMSTGSISALADEDGAVVGTYLGVKFSRLTIDVPHKGTRTFVVNNKTRVNSSGVPYDIKKIPRHSVVRVLEKDDVVSVVIVEEVPR
ncbi:hypothetical protein [Geotalea toluenoxydans]|uniref:hypothetical protein n=1 Tax=Geotalea toluenoxydans TaxID=421624 RepID=UPI0006D106DC|nr:hypothetical protein [Geotalea toluenoxydans]